jgi:hypothetical protein
VTNWETVKGIVWSAEFIAPLATLVEIFAFPILSVETSSFEKLALFLLQYVALKAALRISKSLKEIQIALPSGAPFLITRGQLTEKLPETLRKAKSEIWISGVSLHNLCIDNFPLLKEKYREGCNIKILLTDPSQIENSAKMTNWSKTASMSDLIVSMKNILKFWKEVSSEKKGTKKKGTIIAKLLPSFPGYGLQMIDPDENFAKIKVEIYTMNGFQNLFPNFFVDKACQNVWFTEFRNQFKKLWELSYDLTDGKVVEAEEIYNRMQQ